MANNIEDFFNAINEKLWKKNIQQEADKVFSQMIEELQENKNEIISWIVDDIKRIEAVKTEENEEFAYASFKKWLNKYVRENIQSWLEE